jgi:hypothetical protein
MKELQVITNGNTSLARAVLDKLVHLGYKVPADIPLDEDHYYTDSLSNEILGEQKYGRDVTGFGEFITLDQLFAMTPELPKETITIGSNVYDKAEFEEATKHLKTK